MPVAGCDLIDLDLSGHRQRAAFKEFGDIAVFIMGHSCIYAGNRITQDIGIGIGITYEITIVIIGKASAVDGSGNVMLHIRHREDKVLVLISDSFG